MPRDLQTELGRAAEFLAAARKIVVLTGAGVSKESGIPTFRDAQTGLWAQYDPQKLATAEGFLRDPSLVWRWYDFRRKMIRDIKPNAGHFALAEMERMFSQFKLLTQNIDGLHRAAGSTQLIELHGSIDRFKCFDRGHSAQDVLFELEEPPLCECGSLIRPDIVWFGEALDGHSLQESFRLSESADVFIVVGTSALVYPAASFPLVASDHGAKVIECNMEETPIAEVADVFLEGPSGNTLPNLVALLKKVRPRNHEDS